MSKQITKQQDPRDVKAKALVQGVIILNAQTASVQSGEKIYTVNFVKQTDDCPDHIFRHNKCKHIRAVNLLIAQIKEVMK